LVKRHRIDYYEKNLGQLFCRERSDQIVEMLLKECRKAKVKIETNCSVSGVEKDEQFVVETNRDRFKSESLVIASGGLSFPKVGATNFGYKIARQFGMKIEATRPSLVPMVFKQPFGKSNLGGIAFETEVSVGTQSFRENILFTHRGLSGPAILQASNYWKPDEDISLNLLPNSNFAEILAESRNSKQTLAVFLRRFFPERFAESFAEKLPNKPVNELSNQDIETIADAIHNWRVRFHDTEGWHKAEVTLGGVSTEELSSKTMESKRVPGLYFIGEIVDVTGWLGGYNFQWAWSSGFAAGNAV
ncbi:MAG: NAD(P)/FAD-dependent oxidoreductase, partial [Pyrinomonadaceae bacterium]